MGVPGAATADAHVEGIVELREPHLMGVPQLDELRLGVLSITSLVAGVACLRGIPHAAPIFAFQSSFWRSVRVYWNGVVELGKLGQNHRVERGAVTLNGS